MGTGWDPLPSRVFLRTKGSVNPGQWVFRQQGGNFNSLLSKWNLASTSLAFCNFDGQSLLRILLPIPSFMYSFIQQVLSTVTEYKRSISHNHILHLYRAFTLCRVISSTSFFCFCLQFYSLIVEAGLVLLKQFSIEKGLYIKWVPRKGLKPECGLKVLEQKQGCEGLMVVAGKGIPGRRNSLSKGWQLRIGCVQPLSCFLFCLEDKRNMGFGVGHTWVQVSTLLFSLSPLPHKAKLTVSAVSGCVGYKQLRPALASLSTKGISWDLLTCQALRKDKNQGSSRN